MKQKKRHKMMFGLWLGFMGLAGAMALLFWMVLHFSVKNKYQEQTENDLKMAAQSIWDMYGDADFEANIALLAKSNDYFVQIVSENSMQVVFSVNNQGEKTAPQQADIADETMFERLNDSDGICQYYVEDQVHASRWAVQAVVLANLNGSRQVLVVSRSQANMDALMKLLTSRYLLVTVTVLILALILSVCLAEYFARPFRHLNKSALQMAAGDYETEFMREGPLEARQLADTLELAEQEFARQVERLAPLAEQAFTGKRCAFFSITANNLANVRKGGDYVAQMIEMAGGDYVFADLTDNGNNLSTMNLPLEDFYAGAKDADVLLYNSTIEGVVHTTEELVAKCPLLAEFKAVQSGSVWCTTQSFFQQSTALVDFVLDLHRVFTENDPADLQFLRKVE